MHRKSPRTLIRHLSPVNAVVYVCKYQGKHPTQRLDAVFFTGHSVPIPRLVQGVRCSVLDGQISNGIGSHLIQESYL